MPDRSVFLAAELNLKTKVHEDTARREAEEELDLPGESIELLGRVGHYQTQSGFLITPMVRLLRSPLAFRPSQEIAEIFELPPTQRPGSSCHQAGLFRRANKPVID